jgi:hypothetical protein
MEDIIERRHFAVAVIMLDGYFSITEDITKMMDDVGLEANYKKRILFFLASLSHTQAPKWNFDVFLPELSNLTQYLLHKLVLFKDEYVHCCAQLERRMRKEYDTGILDRRGYFFLRRCYFELKRVVKRLDSNDHYNISYTSENHMKIMYQHI